MLDLIIKNGSCFIDGNIQNGKGIKNRLRDLMIYWILGPDKAKLFFEDPIFEAAVGMAVI